MSSIDSVDIIRTMLKNDGAYPGDPPCSAIYRYVNMWGGTTFKVCYNAREEDNFIINGCYNSYCLLFRNGELTEEGRLLVGN